MTRKSSDTVTLTPVPRRGLSREEAAIYVGVGLTKFEEMVAAGEMPRPKRVGTRTIWDVRALDLAFDALPDNEDRGGWERRAG